MVNFDTNLYAHLPLGTEDKYMNPAGFPIPISYIFGDRDYMRTVELDFTKQIVDINKEKFPG